MKNKENKKLYIPLVVFFIIVLIVFIQLMRNAEGDDPKKLESALVGKTVPISTALSLENKPYDQMLFKQGKPILLNVWATWCPTCYAEHQYLNQLAKQGITIIGIDYKDDTDKALKWLKELGNPYQVVLKDQRGTLGLDLGVYGDQKLLSLIAKV